MLVVLEQVLTHLFVGMIILPALVLFLSMCAENVNLLQLEEELKAHVLKQLQAHRAYKDPVIVARFAAPQESVLLLKVLARFKNTDCRKYIQAFLTCKQKTSS